MRKNQHRPGPISLARSLATGGLCLHPVSAAHDELELCARDRSPTNVGPLRTPSVTEHSETLAAAAARAHVLGTTNCRDEGNVQNRSAHGTLDLNWQAG